MDWSVLWDYRAALASGLLVTIGMSIAGIIGATLVGVLVGCLGTIPSYLLQRLTGTYTAILRNLPLIVKLFFLYFVVNLGALTAAIAALILHQSAYIADITAAGLRSIPTAQFDAGRSLGHSRRDIFRFVILPQAARIVLPPLTSQYVSVIKNSSVLALIGIADLTFETQQINVETFRGFEAATAATLLYLLLAAAVIFAMTRLQHRRARAPTHPH